jgi:glycosyltransferase involved in cell wall biosynthesis
VLIGLLVHNVFIWLLAGLVDAKLPPPSVWPALFGLGVGMTLLMGFGLPPVEAMWCGCPVIASKAGAVPEVCGDAALWFDAAAPESLGEAVASLADDAERRAGLVEAGRARVQHFSWEQAARRLLGFLPR